MKQTTILSIVLCTFFVFSSRAQFSIEWQRSVGLKADDVIRSIDNTSDGGFILTGESLNAPQGKGGRDVLVIKLDAQGMVQWRKFYGGSYWEEAHCVIQTLDGGYIIAGYSESKDGDITAHHGNINVGDAWVLKLDHAGELQWQRSVGGDGFDFSMAICQAADGAYVLAGITASNGTGDIDSAVFQSSFLAKLSTQGDIQWLRTYWVNGSGEVHCISPTRDNGYIFSCRGGGSNYSAVVIKVDSVGTIEWDTTYGGQLYDFFYSIKQTADGGYICAGASSSANGDLTHNFGDLDTWFAKLDTGGNRIWMASYGGAGIDRMHSIVEMPNGNFLAAGETSSPEHDVIGYHPPEGSDGWIIELSPAGDMVWNKAFGGSTRDLAVDIVPASDGGFVFVGSAFSTNGDLAPFVYSAPIWVVKLKEPGGSVIADALSSSPLIVTLSSNPVVDGVVFNYQLARPGHVKISVINTFGQTMRSLDRGHLSLNEYQTLIDTQGLPPGMYTYLITLDNYTASGKFILKH